MQGDYESEDGCPSLRDECSEGAGISAILMFVGAVRVHDSPPASRTQVTGGQ